MTEIEPCDEILALWRAGRDTLDIANALGLLECDVANNLPKILEQRNSRMPKAAVAWSDERIEMLKKLHGIGWSASQIAAEMGFITRNAVLGKVHRLGLSEERPARKPKEPTQRLPRIRFMTGHARPAPLMKPDEVQLRCAEVVPRHVSMLDLAPGECRYPYGDGPFTFCGNKSEGTYCTPHDRLSKRLTRPVVSHEQQLQSRREYMAAYRASKRVQLEAMA